MLSSVLAHQGGWDEILFVVVPIAIFAGLLAVANRRASRIEGQRDQDDRAGRAGRASQDGRAGQRGHRNQGDQRGEGRRQGDR